MTPYARRLSLALLAWVLVAAVFSVGYFHPDELHQTLDFAAFKVGMFGADEMPWEFGRGMRPWTQPALYTAIFAGARAVGVHSALVLMGLCRAVTGVLAWAAARALLAATLPHAAAISSDAERTHTRVLTLLPCLPYMFVRTSSETLSGACLAAALAALAPYLAFQAGKDGRTRRDVDASRAAWAGLALGAAFATRYQTAFASLGLFGWLAWTSRARLRTLGAMLGGGLVALALATLADTWGYGRLTFTPWNYVRVNLLEGVAASFGKDPFFGYLYLLPANALAPVVVLLMITGALFMWRFPWHAFTWTTVPYVALHCLIGHKEERFMFPLLGIGAATIVPALAHGEAPRVARLLWAKRRSVVARALGVYSFAIGALLTLYPFNVHAQTRALYDLYTRSPAESWVMFAMNVEHAPVYRARGSTWVSLTALDRTTVAATCAFAPAPVFLITAMDETVPWAAPVYTDAPFGSAALARAVLRWSHALQSRFLSRMPIPIYLTVHVAPASMCTLHAN